MQVGDLIKRKWDVAKQGPLPSGYKTGVIIELRENPGGHCACWAVVRWLDGHGVGNSLYHPENLEIISESR